MNEEDASKAKLFWDASSLPGRPGLSFIGPFGRRVSFASQQARAFNTVWAWSRRSDDPSNADVAVIGGGLAGLTVSSALIAKKHSVTLFEANTVLVKNQTAATHRYVHPTINFWPEQEIRATTRHPYLDWYEGLSSTVANRVQAEWDKYFKTNLVKFGIGCTITAIQPGGDRPLAKWMDVGTGKEVSRAFDHIFVASGFGHELYLQQSDVSYWCPDGLEGVRDAGRRAFLVAGTGDGGSIEVLRLLQVEFDKGRLCLDIVEDMVAAGLAKPVSEIEQEVADNAVSAEQAALQYHRLYREFVRDRLTLKIRGKLAQRYSGLEVRMVGTVPAPFSLHAAPIHKIMIAAALEDGAFTFVEGTVEAQGSGYAIKAPDGSCETVDSGTKVIVRAGARGALDWLLSGEEIAQLELQQHALSDILRPSEMDMAFFEGFDGVPRRDPADLGFVRFRKTMSEDYLWERFRAQCELASLGDVNGYRAFFQPSTVDQKRVPTDLFGIPLEFSAKVVAKWA